EVQEYAAACSDLAFNLLLRGYPREAWSWLERIPPRREIQNACAASVLAFLGRPSDSHQHLERQRRLLAEGPGDRARKLHYDAHLAFACVESGELGAPLDEAIKAFDALGVAPKSAPFQTRHFYLAKAHARLARLSSALREDSGRRAGSIKRARGDLDRAIAEL